MLRPSPLLRMMLLGAAALALQGCAAAAIPVLAGGLLVTKQANPGFISDTRGAEVRSAQNRPIESVAVATAATPAPAGEPAPTLLPASRALLESLNAPAEAPEVELIASTTLPRPGDASAGGLAARLLAGNRAYDPFFGYVLSQVSQDPLSGEERQSALLSNPGKLDADTLPCGFRPPAVMIDIDPADGLVPLTGEPSLNAPLARVVSALRARGVTIFWVTGRTADHAGEVRTRLILSDLDPAAEDRLIVMRYPQDRKQTRRRAFADEHCIVALLGDEKSDFDELYDYLRTPDDAVTLERLVGNRWFLAPTPLD
ncbi:hypothetical protein ACFCW2_06530 [Qipengyuania sp. DSG2-2]|uniref:hypothetical protein n=1 Tax=Qipengyuania sp. DGS2-2 TaxID=3349631 RepID=UPI0036D2D33B